MTEVEASTQPMSDDDEDAIMMARLAGLSSVIDERAVPTPSVRMTRSRSGDVPPQPTPAAESVTAVRSAPSVQLPVNAANSTKHRRLSAAASNETADRTSD